MNAFDEEEHPDSAESREYPADIAETDAFAAGEKLSALLFMLEDLDRSQKQIEQAHQEWIAAVDTIHDPIFMHDKDYRIMRSNHAYAERAGMSFKAMIGRPYYEVFPKLDGPLPACCKSMQEAEEEEIQLAGGEIFASRSFSVRDKDGGYLYSLHVMEDITERKRMQHALLESEEKFRQISATAQDAILMMDSAGRIVFWNNAAERIFGYTAEETLGKELHTLIVPERFRGNFHEKFPAFVATGSGPIVGKTVELAGARKNGAEFPVELSVSAVKLGDQWHAVGFIRDISKRKQAEEELRLRAQMLNSVSDSIFVLDLDGNFVYLNEAAWKSRGYTQDEMMGINLHVLDTPEYEKIIEARMKELMEKGRCFFESEHRRKDGSVMPVEINARLLELGGRKLVISVIRDITERKRMEGEVRRKSVELEEAQRISHTGNWTLDIKTGAIIWSEELYRIFGLDPALPAPNIDEHAQILTPESLVQLNSAIEKTLQTGEPYEIDLELIRPGGNRGWITARGEVSRDASGRNVGLRGTAIDITERKRSEQALHKLNRAFKALSAGNHELVHASDETQLLQAMCRVLVEVGGYRMAWVGYVQHDAEKTIRPMAQYGFEAGFLEMARLIWADNEHGQGPGGRAARSGLPQVSQNILSDPSYTAWRTEAVKRGYASVIGLPLLDGDEVFGIMGVYAAEADAFDVEEVVLLEEMADDLAFGIRMLRLRQAQQRSAEQVRLGLEGTVQAIAAMVEMRDPYTAGHQRRVADLAAAIATEMGLPEERVRGIHLAGTIHDLGKIQIPAEILSKPGKLSTSEFNLIKDHPQNGYEILKDIEFPWPIAQMVLQHHEKLDGSGYPQGLKGEAILLEARIMTVADVVEAMSSHRPYRPGLGLDVALEEIIKGRGTHYDPDAVDVSVRLFREKGYKL